MPAPAPTRAATRHASRPVDVSFTDVSYDIPPPRPWHRRLNPLAPPPAPPARILHAISGHVRAGESLAILGPSGSGKTSLLNLLAARSAHPPSSGRILFAGAPRVPRTKRHIGYVMQDDVFFSKLTVRETLQFTADLRVPALSAAQRRRRVDDVVAALRLGKCQHTRVGDQQFDKGISGGERKRLNIANELLHDPAILLADESTSGLDSSSAFTVVRLLSHLCRDGRTVIATIHQPSSHMFTLFDNIMLLAAGRVAYFGPPQAVLAYFDSIHFPFPHDSYNPADYMLELVIDDDVKLSDSEPADHHHHHVSSQRAILDAWQRNGPHLLEQARPKHTRKPRPLPEHLVLHLDPPAPAPDPDPDHHASPSPTLTPSDDQDDPDDRSTDDNTAPSSSDAPLPNDPPPPTTRLARLRRASTKRFRDITGQHGKHGEPDKYPTTWLHQVRVLARRALRQKRGVLIQPVYIAQVVCVTVVSALVWWQIEPTEGTIEDRLGALSFFSVFWAFYSTFSALFAFPAEKRVLNKDRAGGSYRLSAYYFAKTTVETPADMLYPILFSVVVYYIIGLNSRFTSFLLFTVILVLNVLAAQSIGLLISAVVMDVRQAQVLASIWILTSMLISGYYINPDNTPSFLNWVRSLSFIKYSYEAMVRTEMLAPQEFSCAPRNESTVYSQGPNPCPIRAEQVLRGAQLEDSLHIAANIGVLILWIVVARLLGYFALKLLHTSHKPKSSTWKQSQLE